jgi:hypothetical protein
MRDESSTSLSDRRANSVILMGINKWVIRLTAPLRFRVKWEQDKQILWISGRQNPSRKDWASNHAEIKVDLSED